MYLYICTDFFLFAVSLILYRFYTVYIFFFMYDIVMQFTYFISLYIEFPVRLGSHYYELDAGFPAFA